MYFFVELSMPWATDEESTIAIITNEKQWRCKSCSPNLTNESRRHTINACANCATYTETSAAWKDDRGAAWDKVLSAIEAYHAKQS